jgi:Ni,Fe-hydrogenase III large subunit
LDQARIREIVLETVERVTGKRTDFSFGGVRS